MAKPPTSLRNTHTATLVHGRVYYLGNKAFEVGVPVKITDEEKATLEEEAKDNVSQQSGDEVVGVDRQKFTFKLLPKAEAVPATESKESVVSRYRDRDDD